MSLRGRLLAGLLGLSLLGMVAVGGRTYLALRSFLIGRVDQQLVNARRSVGRGLADPSATGATPVDAQTLRDVGPTDTFYELRDAAGQIEVTAQAGAVDQLLPAPRLPAVLHPPPALAVPFATPALSFDAAAVSGSGSYRVQVSSLPDGRGLLVVAMPLGSLNATLSRLIEIEIVIATVVLALLATGAFALLRRGLRPLERIAKTAEGIADGDLDVRVTPADARSEIGRLGLALNGMLERLEDAFARRDRSEEQLRRFVANASHELRTPLTSIRGYAALFRRGARDNPDDLATSMDRIESEATRMGALIDDMLLLARLDEQRPLEHRPVDLMGLARDAVADARARDPDGEIALRERSPLIVVGDELRLRQVAANLIANAQLHTPPKTPVEVEVDTRGDQATLTVSDHGPGIDPKQATHVFERFFRGSSSGARDEASQSSGSGLGLAIVAAIMTSHAGTATLRPTRGGGATFEVSLPLAAVGAPSGEPSAPPPGPLAPDATR
jgi:two-component system, OmpR family, sensor kinase